MGELFRSYATLGSGLALSFIVGPLFATALLAMIPPFMYVVLKGV